jgi:ketosteroid isomerase-like protein
MFLPKTILLVIVIFITGSGLRAQVPGDANPKLEEFQLQTIKWKDAYNSGNAQNLLPLYTTDARYISSHVSGLELIGRDKVIANFQNGMKMGGHIDTVEVLSMNSSADLVTLLCKYQATNSGQTVTGRNLTVLKKVNGAWLISIHMTVV